MTTTGMVQPRSRPTEVTMWFDPVCPFSWITARWLNATAAKLGFDVDWQLMNLAVLNEGKPLPPAQQARMNDSRQIGRLMAGIRRDKGSPGLAEAYFAFGERYFDHAASLDDQLVDYVLAAAAADGTSVAALSDASLDDLVHSSHQAGQDALGETGGSPIVRIAGNTLFGPVLTAMPAGDMFIPLFDAIATLASTEQFAQLQRPRAAH
ncbi:hypothetical protein [uncultured Mycobacterium sp.]|uniref:mycothiol-dependent nitroreductase Rv2466c family protein n=1 Tax=uncultured Mycobacterium sp. TaxID=171292 RepID=UPI0035CA9F7F